MTYEEMQFEYQNLLKQKNAINSQMVEIKRSMAIIESDKADRAYREIQERMKLINSLGYVLDVKIWNNDCGDYEWDSDPITYDHIRLRRRDEVIVG